MRPETRNNLDRFVWQGKVCIGLGVALFGALYLYVNRPDPVVETRILSGMVTNFTRQQTEFGAGAFALWVSLDGGGNIMITQRLPSVPRLGPAEI